MATALEIVEVSDSTWSGSMLQLLGTVADHINMQVAFIVPLIAYSYVAFYGLKGHKIGRERQLPT